MGNRLPCWFKQELPDKDCLDIQEFLKQKSISTVCVQAKCPNKSSCFKRKELTFLILGKVCTRHCRFCNVEKNNEALADLDAEEAERIAESVKSLGIKYCVVTSVCRDDLEDQGAAAFAQTIKSIRMLNPETKIEVLIPDFGGRKDLVEPVVDSNPEVIGHNIETIARLYPEVRPEASYAFSLNILKEIKNLKPGIITKSSIMLGLGETKEEVMEAMRDLIESRVDMLTLGQYLAPSKQHFPVKEFIDIYRFQEYKDIAKGLGFKSVLSGPCVRSSYGAEEIFKELSYAL